MRVGVGVVLADRGLGELLALLVPAKLRRLVVARLAGLEAAVRFADRRRGGPVLDSLDERMRRMGGYGARQEKQHPARGRSKKTEHEPHREYANENGR